MSTLEERAREWLERQEIRSAEVNLWAVLAEFCRTELEQAEELRKWKESAIQVLNGIQLQEIGRVLGLRLGDDIGPKILPAIQEAQSALREAREENLVVCLTYPRQLREELETKQTELAEVRELLRELYFVSKHLVERRPLAKQIEAVLSPSPTPATEEK